MIPKRPELLKPGYYLLWPVDDGAVIPTSSAEVECPSCGRDCIMDAEHAQSVRHLGLTVACFLCQDPSKTPYPNCKAKW